MNTHHVFGYICAIMLGIIGWVIINDEYPTPIVLIKDIPDIEYMQIATTDGVSVSVEEFECLQRNIYFEARNQSRKGMRAVGWVTVNRVNNEYYPDSICDVVYQGRTDEHGKLVKNACQFSWACNGKEMSPILSNAAERAAWELAGTVAERVLRAESENEVGKATHYHANYVNPFWSHSERFTKVKVIESHIFYEDIAIRDAMVYNLASRG